MGISNCRLTSSLAIFVRVVSYTKLNLVSGLFELLNELSGSFVRSQVQPFKAATLSHSGFEPFPCPGNGLLC